jgi:hypothetical protein
MILSIKVKVGLQAWIQLMDVKQSINATGESVLRALKDSEMKNLYLKWIIQGRQICLKPWGV